MNDRPLPPHSPSARSPFSLIVGGKKPDPEDSPRIWKSCLARLVINASFMEPILVNAMTDKDQDPIHHYHLWSHAGLVMRIIGPNSSLKWTDMFGKTEVGKLGEGCLFYPSPCASGSPPFMQMAFDEDRLNPRHPNLPDEVNDHWFNAKIPEPICEGIVRGIKLKGIHQLLVSAYFTWNLDEGQNYGWVSDDFVVFKLEGADWYPIPEDFFH